MDGKKTEQLGMLLFGCNSTTVARTSLLPPLSNDRGRNVFAAVLCLASPAAGTVHPYADNGQYQGVVIRDEIDQPDINMVRFLEDQVKGENGKSDCTAPHRFTMGAIVAVR